MKIEMVNLVDIKHYDKNPRRNDEAVKFVMRSIKDFGFRVPIVVDKNMTIVAGHTRAKAAKELKLKEVPVVVADDLTPEQINAFRIADNSTAQRSEWDLSLLDGEIKSLPGYDFMNYGLDYVPRTIEQEQKENDVPEEPKTPRSVKGDIYILGGKHRVMCGDSCDFNDVEKLMDKQTSTMVFTDPPYNVDYGKCKGNPRFKIRHIKNDKQVPEAWEAFCKDFIDLMRAYNSGDIYMWGASGPEGMKQRLWLTEAGCHWSATIVWVKDKMILTPANYQRQYELCFYGWFKKSSWQGSRTEKEVWSMKRPQSSELHPTMKPIELCEKGIVNSSKVGDIVLDLFLGSGSTLIAAEKVGRICYGCEIMPEYCDVIVQRYCDYVGKNKVILNGKEIEW